MLSAASDGLDAAEDGWWHEELRCHHRGSTNYSLPSCRISPF